MIYFSDLFLLYARHNHNRISDRNLLYIIITRFKLKPSLSQIPTRRRVILKMETRLLSVIGFGLNL